MGARCGALVCQLRQVHSLLCRSRVVRNLHRSLSLDSTGGASQAAGHHGQADESNLGGPTGMVIETANAGLVLCWATHTVGSDRLKSEFRHREILSSSTSSASQARDR